MSDRFMSNVNASAVIHADQHAETKTTKGTLKTEGKDYSFFPFAETESASQGASEFLAEMNGKPELPEILLSERNAFTEITQEKIEIETEIGLLLEEFDQPETQHESTKKAPQDSKPVDQTQKNAEKKPLPQSRQQTHTTESEQKQETVYSSLFSLAHSFNKGLTEARKQQLPQQQEQKQTEKREKTHPNQPMAFSTSENSMRNTLISETRQDNQDKEKEDEQKEGSGGQQQQQQQEEQKKRRELFNVKTSRSVSRVQTAKESASTGKSTVNSSKPIGGVENVYIRFMALMARILGQAEAEAHELYTRIKERTDNIDALTLLITKINSEKESIDWSDNQEMKQLIEKVRALGVDIPKDKFTWSEEEKKLLKENIQLRKDSMEKVTQLERTDMQRYLQEASQCHQARSNVLKLLKEVMDTIIHNMRP